MIAFVAQPANRKLAEQNWSCFRNIFQQEQYSDKYNNTKPDHEEERISCYNTSDRGTHTHTVHTMYSTDITDNECMNVASFLSHYMYRKSVTENVDENILT